MFNKKRIKGILVAGFIVLVLVMVGGAGYFLLNKQTRNGTQKQNKDQSQSLNQKIDGECGSAIADYNGPAPYKGTPAPKENLCKAGNPSEVTSEAWAHFSWWCKGINEGDDQYCDTHYPMNNDGTMIVVDGECGPATSLKFPFSSRSSRYNRLCEHGEPSSINNNSWKCYGVNGGGKAAVCNIKVPTDQEIKNYFKATEIVNFNILNSYNISFWAEANCPYSGKGYEYQIPSDYGLGSCENGEIGSHGGCPTCEMSEINLIADRADPNSLFLNNTKIKNKILRESYIKENNILPVKINIDDSVFSDDDKIKNYLFAGKSEELYENSVLIERMKDIATDNEIVFLSYSTKNCMGGNCLGGNIILYKNNNIFFKVQDEESVGGAMSLEKLNEHYLLGTTIAGCCAGCVAVTGSANLFIVENGTIYFYELNGYDSEGGGSYDIESEYSMSSDGKKLTEIRALNYYGQYDSCTSDGKLLTKISETTQFFYNDKDNSFESQ